MHDEFSVGFSPHPQGPYLLLNSTFNITLHNCLSISIQPGNHFQHSAQFSRMLNKSASTTDRGA
jgi:hypothetical protein